ncbi:hypothetical protein BATDEDRAFT_35019 [Batrachochytrium dendrobatidis JAM81]|uniref:LisH domain-containing protein n=2 Tax=Batrachochytrium dendrobatidis TaxID=109871 RepID=F4P212_BATDJ|nr:uncharacterized protein BATDEDRAFT_35019 [Batrachochytrium dendrobatidis JAM81]EGF81033.1 hypothetical protein BATDEDRAFT_35019 [Batrachochytrium dendrobatidis JAM81]KAJ8329035.1 hypothetical protein O5D80_002992 [Batrachochytrium dendrobatidis]KAK5668983.1 hypothetical protein QVD99_004754 [Batrachochytrium dendrobatidis]OAJ41908.1 hypothetical protein BDEG_25437 [Batrachochytrium dendrobatidis JEL423]|eukprot:XP_006678589.1 hypothetical protein BATDEDRAFT_35019 [Batrachochytrium dendrobatidis JAM81]
MSITSDEVNYLVYRYLLESGFTHSTFSFQHETAIHRAEVKGSSVRPGALISLLQKGLQYLEVETHIQENGNEKRCIAPFTLLGPHECQIVPNDFEDDFEETFGGNRRGKRNDDLQCSRRERRDERKSTKRSENREKRQRKESITIDDNTDTATSQKHEGFGSNEVEREIDMDMDTSVEAVSHHFNATEIQLLIGHQAEVFVCSWNPKEALLATGSGDGTARIWSTSENTVSNSQYPVVLQHSSSSGETKDVTTLDWSPDGVFLATGSYDGLARIWHKTGTIKFTMHKHQGPVFSLRWGKNGDLLLSGSVDRTAIVWDAKTGEARQQFQFHSGPTLDVDWKDDSTFATCSTDKQIYICQLGSLEPLKHFTGHEGEVNAIKWDSNGTYLASCSDDHTAKVWSLDQDTPVWDLVGHQKEIYTMRWSPRSAENNKLFLATASFDSEVRIWNIQDGTCMYVLTGHTDAVYSVSFSPDLMYLASGSFDHCVFLWSLKDGALLKTHQGGGGVFEVGWSHVSNHIAACYTDKKVIVFSV